MSADALLQDITHTIQLAVAPVFLLTALGTTLGVLATRLGRVVDRARRVEARLRSEEGAPRLASQAELRQLADRARLILFAITAGTTAALLVCLLIAVAFLGYLFDASFGNAVAILFVLAIGSFVLALLFFLREVYSAITTLNFDLAGEAGPEPRA
jgi:uncharacterized membrane protein (DUF485 family)